MKKEVYYELSPYEKLWCAVFDQKELLIRYDPKTDKVTTLMTMEDEKEIEKALASLPRREETTLRMRFGLKGSQVYIWYEIGCIHGLSGEAARQIGIRALEKLSRHLRKLKIVLSPDSLNHLKVELAEKERCCEEVIKLKITKRKINTVMAQLDQIKGIAEKGLNELGIDKELIRKLSLPIDDFELSVRLFNSLRYANLRYIGDLVQKTESEILQFPNVGKACVKEIKSLLAELGLTLNMELSPELIAHIQNLKNSKKGSLS